MNEQPSTERELSARHSVLLIIWAAQVMALVFFLLIALLVFKQSENSSSTWALIFAALGALLVLISFQLKRRTLASAVEGRDARESMARVQTGYIMAWALCEAAGLLGLLTRVFTNSPFFLSLFVIAALGMLLNIPRREQLVTASFKNRF